MTNNICAKFKWSPRRKLNTDQTHGKTPYKQIPNLSIRLNHQKARRGGGRGGGGILEPQQTSFPDIFYTDTGRWFHRAGQRVLFGLQRESCVERMKFTWNDRTDPIRRTMSVTAPRYIVRARSQNEQDAQGTLHLRRWQNHRRKIATHEGNTPPPPSPPLVPLLVSMPFTQSGLLDGHLSGKCFPLFRVNFFSVQ